MPRLPSPVHRVLLAIFRLLPYGARRRVVRALTPHFTVGAVVLLRRPDGSLLLVLQRHTGGWGLPGGHLHRGEEPVDAAVRELAEEVGIRLDPARLTPAVPAAFVAPGPQRVDVIFTADVPGDVDVRPDGVESVRAQWFARDALPECQEGATDVLTACGILP